MKILALFSLLALSSPSFADYESYDEIVSKLSKYGTQEVRTKQAYRPEVRTYSQAHLGLGISRTFYDTDSVGGVQNQGGILINVGVDVLNQHWGLEGSFANFGTQRSDSESLKLREFTIKGLYKPSIDKFWNLRFGLGMSSRFLEINNALGGKTHRTPSGLFLVGVDSYINSFISIGADLNFKTAMIGDSIDKNSVDLAFRIDTHF